MQTPFEITFRGMARSTFVDAATAAWLDRLRRVFDRIEHCHVWIDLPHRHRRGLPFQVKVVLAVPGTDGVVVHGQNTDVYLALGEAFLAARRQLSHLARARRGAAKRHATAPIRWSAADRAAAGSERAP